MYRPRKNAGPADRLEISSSPEPQQPISSPTRGDEQANIQATSKPMARPLRRNTRPGLISISGAQAAQPTSRPAKSVAPPTLSSISTAQAAQPTFRPARSVVQPELSSVPSAQATQPTFRQPRTVPQPSLSSIPTAQAAQPTFRSVRSAAPSTLSSTTATHTTQHPIPHSYRSVGVQVNLPPPPAPTPAPLPAARESRPAVTATPRRAPFRPVKKTTTLGHTPDTAINIPEGTTATPDTATNAPATAPIHEFICLYSHDLRRKQKRWQDGTLRFHTFNQKFMVYDENGVYVGEGHWQGDVDDFQEGLEIKLDRPMACLQVMECTGTKEQDLSQVLGKRVREVEERRAAKAPARRNREIAAPAEIAPEEAPATVIPLTPPRNIGGASTAAVHPPAPRNMGDGGASTAASHPPAPRNVRAGGASTAAIRLMPPKNMGAWSKHAEDLLGRGRPIRR
ncbi:hypothetical protein ACSS6W_000380 [Trichoderma asperelloides]|nr:hypothetical protein LI328DRAFT_93510 [Trichoderma asperelloides]